MKMEKLEVLEMKYCEAVDRNDLLEKYVEELANAIIDNKITPEVIEDAKKYRSNLIRY